MRGVSSVGAKALAAWTWCQDDSSEHKSSKADGCFPTVCPTIVPREQVLPLRDENEHLWVSP